LSVYIRKFRAFLRKNETARGLFLVGIVILGAIAVWGGIRLALNTEYPILVVSSPSMCQNHQDPSTSQCTLPVGALIVIRGESAKDIQVPPASYTGSCTVSPCCPGVSLIPQGSIIVFYHPEDPSFLIVHRVYRAMNISGQIYYDTKGDGNTCDDGDQVAPSNIVGVYQYTIPIPYLGSAILGVRNFMYDPNGNVNPQGILVILALIIALFAFEVLQPRKKTSPDNSKEEPGSAVSNTDDSQPEKSG
jgi:signal peptidase I